ncbi:MAG: response regulator [Vicinamibacterales bacterium]
MSSRPSVLVIDDDLGTREIFERVLGLAGLAATTAGSGAEGIRLAESLHPDLLVVDLRLPDMSGLDVVRMLQQRGHRSAFVLISFWHDTATTVEAMRLGAVDVLDKSQDIDELVVKIRVVVAPRSPAVLSAPAGPLLSPRPSPPADPHSAADRWAWYIRRACDADGDFKTLELLVAWLGVSLSRFNDACRLLAIGPHEARDLARLLRVVIKGAGQCHRFAALLDVSDGRTLEKLWARAGLRSVAADGTVSVEEFLRRQQFVPQDNEGLKALRALLVSRPSA